MCRDGTETYRVRFRNNGASSSVTFNTPEEAHEFAGMINKWGPKRALEFIKQPTEPRRIASGATVSECVKDYIELRANPNTRTVYTRRLETRIQPALGKTRIGSLTHEDVQRWINRQEGGTATLKRDYHLLSGALAAAVSRREIPVNPASGVKIPRRPANKKRAALTPPFTREEYELIRKAMHPRYQVLVEFLAETGCRLGEATALTPADVNLDKGTVHFNKSYSETPGGIFELGMTKTEMSDRIIRVGQALLEKLDLTGEFIFTTQTGGPVKGGAFRTAHWKKALKKSGLPAHRYGHPHDLRHAHATWLLDAGVPLHAIQKRLGHGNVMTTLRMYGHAATDAEDRILAALEGL